MGIHAGFLLRGHARTAGSRLSLSQSLPGKLIIWGIFPKGDIILDYCTMAGEDRMMTGSSDGGYGQGRGDKVSDPLYSDNTAVIVQEILPRHWC